MAGSVASVCSNDPIHSSNALPTPPRRNCFRRSEPAWHLGKICMKIGRFSIKPRANRGLNVAGTNRSVEGTHRSEAAIDQPPAGAPRGLQQLTDIAIAVAV